MQTAVTVYLQCKQLPLLTLVAVQANARYTPNAVSMLGQRLRRWLNIETALGECLVLLLYFVDGKTNNSKCALAK